MFNYVRVQVGHSNCRVLRTIVEEMQKTAAVRSTGDGTPKLTQHQTVQPADNRVSLTRECTTQGGPLWVNDS